MVAARRLTPSFSSLAHWASSSLHPALRALAFASRAYLILALAVFPTVNLPFQKGFGGLKWTRTTDLALIRRAL